MKIPYVIDNQGVQLADILRGILAEYRDRSLDTASAYFTVAGFGLLREGLLGLANFRLLLGAEPIYGEQVGLRPDAATTRATVRRDLEALPFSEEVLRLVEDLIAFLRRDSTQLRLHQDGFLHAKAWIFYADKPGQQELFDRFRPVVGIVGSSNFTYPGLTSNRELNVAHKVLLDPSEVDDPAAETAVRWLSEHRPSERISPENRQLLKSEVGARAILDLERWFEAQWSGARDFKLDLIDLLDASKFGQREYSPYEVYLKALYEYFKGDLETATEITTRSAIELSEFQDDAVRKARAILARYDGVLIADSVGLGKTWIGKKLLEDYAYHLRQKALVICPASLRQMWQSELLSATIAGSVLSQEELGRAEFDLEAWGDADLVLVDESHNFRNPTAQRYQALERILQARGGRGAAGSRKKVILLTATPINNDLFDLYHQLQLITGGDRGYFSAAGVGDLYRYFLRARRASRARAAFELFNLLEEIVIRRTRPFIQRAYPDATIRGERIRFPERRLASIRYDLESTYTGIYEEIVAGVEGLKLAPYNLEAYKRDASAVDELEAGREQALVGIFKSRYLKRLESSVHAFRISVRRALAFLNTFESYILDGRILRSSQFHEALRLLRSDAEEDDETPSSFADAIDADEDAARIAAEMQQVNTADFDLRRLHADVQHDVRVLGEIWEWVRRIGAEDDIKLRTLKELLASDELRGHKVIVFSYFRDTARYLYRELGDPEEAAAREWGAACGGVRVRRLDSGADAAERVRTVQAFAPRANHKPEWVGTDREIDLLISTDVLSEGQNLQDCGILVNYDLHWNPTRMVQRAGRIDRIGSPFDTLWIYNMFPDEGLERLLGLVERLTSRIESIDRAGFHDASILGELVNPHNFNTLRRIGAEDTTVLVEEEQWSELASSEFLSQQLRGVLQAGGRERLESLPDGIHSGHLRQGSRGLFFYFQARPPDRPLTHFWRYVDLVTGRVEDNRLLIGSLISCTEDTPRVIDDDVFSRIFELQEKAIEDVLRSVKDQVAMDESPRVVDPAQQAVAAALLSVMHQAGVDRQRVMEAVRFLRRPLRRAALSDLRGAFKDYETGRDAGPLLDRLDVLRAEVGETDAGRTRAGTGQDAALTKEQLHLVCFEMIGS